MKKALIALTALCLFSMMSSWAQISVVLSDGQMESGPLTVIRDHYNEPLVNVSVTGKTAFNGKIEVAVSVESLNPQQLFWLFGQEHTEKELKNHYPRAIYYDKHFGPHGNTDVYQVGNEQRSYPPDISLDEYQHSCNFPEFSMDEGETATCRLPIYFARNKNGLFCRRTILESEVITTLVITVENPIHEDYFRLSRSCDSLMEAIDRSVFCLHKLHRPELFQQEEPFFQKRDEIKDEIARVLKMNSWPVNSKNYVLFNELDARVDSADYFIELAEVENCGDAKSHVPPHSCSYCSWTMKQIHSRFDLYNKQLDNGDITKESVQQEVNALYKCYRFGPKTKANQRKEEQKQYQEKIKRLYEKINSY